MLHETLGGFQRLPAVAPRCLLLPPVVCHDTPAVCPNSRFAAMTFSTFPVLIDSPMISRSRPSSFPYAVAYDLKFSVFLNKPVL